MLFLLLLLAGDHFWRPTNDPTQRALFENDRQIGVVKISTGEYLAFDGVNFLPGQSPIPIPEELGGPKPAPAKPPEPNPQERPPEILGPPKPPEDKGAKPTGCINYGLDKSELNRDGEYFSYNGSAIDKGAAEDILAGAKRPNGDLRDDSGALRLTIVGDRGRADAVRDIQSNPDWAELGEGILVKDYPPDHWALAGKGYKSSPAKLTFYLTTAEGDLLHQGEDAGGVLDALRRRKNPSPFPSITWNSASIGFNPFSWMAGVAWSNLHIPIDFILLGLAGIVVAVLVLRRPPAPPAQLG